LAQILQRPFSFTLSQIFSFFFWHGYV
jgi:hypothetical protein